MSAEHDLLHRRIKNVVGQLNGIAKMLEAERNCLTILPQLKAVRAGVDKLTLLFVQHNLKKCLAAGGKSEAELEKILLELVRS